MAIQRINYHTGLFLEEAEFKLEQNYHMLMRRRINYALFTPGVLYGMELHYDGSVLTVDPGMAIDKCSYSDPETGINEFMSREIIVLEPDNETDLSSFTVGDEVWITIKYDKEPTNPKTPTDTESRVTEKPIIEPNPSDPGAGDEKILLGKITIGTALNAEPTQKVTLRLGGVPPSLTSIVIVPPSESILENSTIQLTATGTRSDNTIVNLTSTANWLSSNPAVATVDSQGLVSGIATGSATITAESESVTGTATIEVSSAAPILESIEITPNPVTINEGAQVQLTATGTYSDSTTADLTSTATWTSDSASATVSANGLVNCVGQGFVTITAEFDGVTGIASITITESVILVSLDITPDPIEINEGEQIQLTATGTYSDSTTADLTGTATWNSTNPAIAVFVNPVNSPGLIGGNAPGYAQINATAEGQTGTVNVTVSVVAPPPAFGSFKSPGYGNPGQTCGINGLSLDYQPVEVSFSPLPTDPQQHGIPANVTLVTPPMIECEVPAGAQTGPVRISTAGGWVDSTVDWVILD